MLQQSERLDDRGDDERQRLITTETPSQSSAAAARTMNTKTFFGLVVLIEILGVSVLSVVGVWLGKYRGGFAWTEDPKHEFNYHPLLMIIGMIFLYGNGILIYRVFRDCRKFSLKVIHAVIQAAALTVSGVGLKAAFDSHNLAQPSSIPNLYSLHSWLGLTTVILAGLQWFMGFATFLLPFARERHRALLKPIHTYVGAIVFAFATATALTGTTEKILWSLESSYQKLPPEGVLVNCLGLLLLTLLALVLHVVTNPEYQRQPLPTD